MKATPEQFNALGGEKEIELTIPLGLDHITYDKPKRKRKREVNHERIQALLLGAMVVLILIGMAVV